MKRILLVAVILFLGIFGYSKYREIQRFSPPSPYVYEKSDQIDVNYYQQSEVQDYFNQINELEQFVRAAWSGHRIDVLFPRADKALDQTLADAFAEKKARIELLEARLTHSAQLKSAGFDNHDIRTMELTGQSPEGYRAQEAISGFTKVIEVGDTGQMVYLIQQCLAKLGYEIMLDGIYKEITEQAIRSFQEQNGLLPTGSVDQQTLQKLYIASQSP